MMELPTNPAPTDQVASPDVPMGADETLEMLKKDWERLKNQKSRPTGGVEGTTLVNMCFLHNEHYVDYNNKALSLEAKDANKLYLSFNLIAPRWNKLVGRISAFNAPFKSRPDKKDPKALANAEIIDRMIVATDEKVDEISRLRERLYWLGVGGTCFEFVPWVPNANIELMPQFDESGQLLFRNLASGEIVPQEMIESSGQPPENFEIYETVQTVGEIGSQIYGPFNVFMDASVRSVKDLAPDQWVHIAEIKTLGWVKENFPEAQGITKQTDLSLVSSRISPGGDAAGGLYLRDLIPLVQGSMDDNDPDMVIFISSFQPSSMAKPKGRYVCWIPDQQILHDEDNPYEEIPLVDFHWGPVTTSLWTSAYVTPLVAPQRFINKRMSQLGEQSNAAIYSNLLLAAGLTEADIPSDFPGIIKNGVSETGLPNVQRTPPPEIPTWFLESIKMAIQMFNDAAGAADLMEDTKFPGQLRGPMAVPMLQEILDTQWGPLFAHLGERLARVKQMRLNRVKQFYPPVRTMHYTDRTQKDEVMEFHTDEILRSGTNYSVTVERGAVLPELRALREARVSERLGGPLAILYMDERTGRIDKSKVAADLQFGDTGREGREAVYRKLALEIIDMLWEGRPVPPVQPFYDHVAMLDELEAQMATTEFLRASPPIVQMFSDRWTQHQQFLMQEAQAQQAGMQSQMIHSAVAQATQQAAAMAAADAVTQALDQVKAQNQQPTDQYVASAQAAQPQQAAPPKPKKRSIKIEESE